MPDIRKLALLMAALTSVLVLAACGSDDSSDDSSEDEDQITEAIEFSATSGDPAACTEAQTANFTQQTSGGPGQSAEEAVASCKKQAADTPADEVEVSNIEIDGDSATADAAVTGNLFDGQTLDLALVKEGDAWKLDRFAGFAEFDREALERSF